MRLIVYVLVLIILATSVFSALGIPTIPSPTDLDNSPEIVVVAADEGPDDYTGDYSDGGYYDNSEILNKLGSMQDDIDELKETCNEQWSPSSNLPMVIAVIGIILFIFTAAIFYILGKGKVKKAEKLESKKEEKMDSAKDNLVGYIQLNLKKGYSPRNIKTMLFRSGVKPDKIEAAFHKAVNKPM